MKTKLFTLLLSAFCFAAFTPVAVACAGDKDCHCHCAHKGHHHCKHCKDMHAAKHVKKEKKATRA